MLKTLNKRTQLRFSRDVISGDLTPLMNTRWSVARAFRPVPSKTKSSRPWTEVESIECNETWQASRLIPPYWCFFHFMWQPRSQGLSSLPPLLVGRKTLVAAGHVTTCETNFSTWVESTNNFVDLNWSERKVIANYTPLKFSSPVESFAQVRRNIFIEASLWFQFQPVYLTLELKLFRYFILPELISRHIVR